MEEENAEMADALRTLESFLYLSILTWCGFFVGCGCSLQQNSHVNPEAFQWEFLLTACSNLSAMTCVWSRVVLGISKHKGSFWSLGRSRGSISKSVFSSLYECLTLFYPYILCYIPKSSSSMQTDTLAYWAGGPFCLVCEVRVLGKFPVQRWRGTFMNCFFNFNNKKTKPPTWKSDLPAPLP